MKSVMVLDHMIFRAPCGMSIVVMVKEMGFGWF